MNQEIDIHDHGNVNDDGAPLGSLDVRVMASYRAFTRKRRLARVYTAVGVAIGFCLSVFWHYAPDFSKPQPYSIEIATQRSHSALVPVSSDIGYMTDLDLRGFQVANDGKIAILRVDR